MLCNKGQGHCRSCTVADRSGRAKLDMHQSRGDFGFGSVERC